MGLTVCTKSGKNEWRPQRHKWTVALYLNVSLYTPFVWLKIECCHCWMRGMRTRCITRITLDRYAYFMDVCLYFVFTVFLCSSFTLYHSYLYLICTCQSLSRGFLLVSRLFWGQIKSIVLNSAAASIINVGKKSVWSSHFSFWNLKDNSFCSKSDKKDS